MYYVHVCDVHQAVCLSASIPVLLFPIFMHVPSPFIAVARSLSNGVAMSYVMYCASGFMNDVISRGQEDA